MSQQEPYVCVKRTGESAETSRPFAKLSAARTHAKRYGYNTIAQKKRGHAGLTIVEEVKPSKRMQAQVLRPSKGK